MNGSIAMMTAPNSAYAQIPATGFAFFTPPCSTSPGALRRRHALRASRATSRGVGR